MTSANPRTREIRLRRIADRRGYTLSKSRRRDPLAVDYGQWTLRQGRRILGAWRDLDGVEQYLTEEK